MNYFLMILTYVFSVIFFVLIAFLIYLIIVTLRSVPDLTFYEEEEKQANKKKIC